MAARRFDALDQLVSMEIPLANLEVMQAHWAEHMPPVEGVPGGAPIPPVERRGSDTTMRITAQGRTSPPKVVTVSTTAS